MVQGNLSLEEAGERIARIQALSAFMEIVPATEVLLPCFHGCCEFDHAAYDTAFLALAEARGIPFITADERFYRKVRPRSRHAMLLRDLTI